MLIGVCLKFTCFLWLVLDMTASYPYHITTTGTTIISTPQSTSGWYGVPNKNDIDAIGDRLGKIEEILGILYLSDDVKENTRKHEMLREAYLKYKMLEKLIVEK
jgi:hypothetical protein